MTDGFTVNGLAAYRNHKQSYGSPAETSVNAADNSNQDFSDYENIDLGAGQKTATLNGDKHCVDATKGKKLIYVNSEKNKIKTDGDDIIAISNDIDPTKVQITGNINFDNIFFQNDLTDKQTSSFEETNKAFYS